MPQTQEHKINIINDFPPEKYNLLIPVLSFQEINPIYRIITNIVKISSNLDDKEIYEERNAEKNAGSEKMYALTHKALMKLATAANVQIVETTRVQPRACEKCVDIVKATGQAPACGNCSCVANVAYRVTMKFPELSGGWRIVQATREIDFSAMDHLKQGQVLKIKEFAAEHAESKAMNRCIRKGLSIKSSYKIEEFEKPFVVAYPVLDARDADVKKALIAGSLAATNLLYGSGLPLPQHQIQELAPPETESTIQQGQPIDPDYEVEQPDLDQDDQNQADDLQRYFCSQCGAEIAENVAEYSKRQYSAPLCFKCQQTAKKGGGR